MDESGDRYQRLLDLAERFLYEPHPGTILEEGGSVRPRLIVGEIPEDLGVQLPIPRGAKILGTLIRSRLYITIMFETLLGPGEVDRFYRDRLMGEGWEPLKEPEFMGGFETTYWPWWGARLVSPHLGARLLIGHRPEEPGSLNAVELRLFSQPRGAERSMERPTFPVPELKAPPGSIQLSSGGQGSGSDGEARFYQDVATINYVTNPADHYHRQLERAGWRLESEASLPNGISSHSIWTFRDDKGDAWRGVLLVVEKSRIPRRYTAYMEAQWLARNLLKRWKATK